MLADSIRAPAGGRPDDDGLEAQLVELSANRDFMKPRTGARPDVRQGRHAGGRSWSGTPELAGLLLAFRTAADADLAACLERELRAPVARYQQLKAAAGALDFLDLLLRARDLIRDDAGARRDFQRRFTRIFVDEFQDTDPLQAELLLLLAADDPDERDWERTCPRRGALFVVGRSQAVDLLPLPPRGSRRVRARALAARSAARAGAAPDEQLSRRAVDPALRQPGPSPRG